jgi:asparagine synthase (glutamine-hydrolysing)
MDGKRAFFARQRASCCRTRSSIVRRVHIPSTQDPAYEKAVRADVAEVLADRSHPAAPLLNRKVLDGMLVRPLGNTSTLADRAGLERARSIGAWVKDYGVELSL